MNECSILYKASLHVSDLSHSCRIFKFETYAFLSKKKNVERKIYISKAVVEFLRWNFAGYNQRHSTRPAPSSLDNKVPSLAHE